ncbi:AMP-binding protein [Rhodococcus sp. CSLK01-03]|uniref:AMP-binding protein n=1 Tax=Rhodococcus indonesiensis TaxID=3055869 RepID=A0ABT7RNY1_9NOCA|nr:AMP-binding protein [Rhodococcus indonesiensis]MDM7489354.1 AMP-binding protein [Rhodococcus indonesiensis]
MEPTPAHVLADRARLTPDAPAYVDSSGRTFAFRDADRRARTLASRLATEGVKPRDRVVVLAKNDEFLATTFFALSYLGAVAVIANWRLPVPELAYVVENSEPVALLHDSEFADTVSALVYATNRADLIRVVSGAAPAGDSASVVDAHETLEQPMGPTLTPVGTSTDPAVIMYTSGTTGRPKGAVLTNANLFWSAQSMTTTISWEPHHRFLLVSPMFHIAGLAPLTASVLRGNATIFMRDFDPVEVWRTIAAQRITTMMAVPLMLQAMLQAARANDVDSSSLLNISCGGSMVPLTLIDGFEELGVNIQVVYGMTEFTGSLTYRLPEMGAKSRASQGKALFGAELKIVDPATGTDAAASVPGEVWCRGPQRFAGYWRNDAATSEAVTVDGWYRSGDIGFLDADGFLHLVDRVKDMLISGGENIYPAELETVIAQHPDVIEVAVVGAPDERWGEVPVAHVVRAEGSSLTEEDVVALCRENLAGFKRPKKVVFIDRLPRNAIGKIQKAVLRA